MYLCAVFHIACGDCVADLLRRARIPGQVAAWDDVLYEGQVPADTVRHQWRAIRATALSDSTNGQLPFQECLHAYEEQDRKLEASARQDEVVLWFDACMHDQLVLAHHLAWFAGHEQATHRLSLICTGSFPGRPTLDGLCELFPEELASLLGTRHEVSAAERDTAVAAWTALRASTPTAIENMLSRGTAALPYLGTAMVRLLEQYPSVQDGLSRLQYECLQVVAGGEHTLAGIMAAVSRMDQPAFFGDTGLWSCLHGMSSAPVPAMEVRGPGPLPLWHPPADVSAWSVAVTSTGRRLLEGELDWVQVCGIDRWIGGVYLHGSESAWRWDRTQSRIECVRPGSRPGAGML